MTGRGSRCPPKRPRARPLSRPKSGDAHRASLLTIAIERPIGSRRFPSGGRGPNPVRFPDANRQPLVRSSRGEIGHGWACLIRHFVWIGLGIRFLERICRKNGLFRTRDRWRKGVLAPDGLETAEAIGRRREAGEERSGRDSSDGDRKREIAMVGQVRQARADVTRNLAFGCPDWSSVPGLLYKEARGLSPRAPARCRTR